MAKNSGPLFGKGDMVELRSKPGVPLAVIDVTPGPPEVRYKVLQAGAPATYYESQLQAYLQATTGAKQFTASQLRAHLTSLQLLSPSTSNLFSLRLGRVKFVPYQYRPVLRMIRADRPRMLAADEVGVGKTIEAGLIIKELRARKELNSILIICPKALVAEKKWFNEMKRFDEEFTQLDGKLLQHCLRETDLDGEWPHKYSTAILPFSLFDSDLEQKLLKLDPPPKFDLVIVDEAHNIRNSATFLHQGVRRFCDNAEAVVFLTATPVQLGSNDLFTLLNVLRPDLVIDHASFEAMAAPNAFINAAVKHCRMAKPTWSVDASNSLAEAGSTEWGRRFLGTAPAFQACRDQLGRGNLTDSDRVQLIRSIEDLYTFSGLINRTRRRDIGEFTTRKPKTVNVEFTPAQRQLHDDLLRVVAKILAFFHGEQNVKFMMTTIRRQAASCLYGLAPFLRDMLNGKLLELETLVGDEPSPSLQFVDSIRPEIQAVIEKAGNLDPNDPKVDAFRDVLIEKGSLANNKALVFSTFRHTLRYLSSKLAGTGLRCGVVHGDVPDDERAILRQRFGLPKEAPNAIDVLLSSEVGCEGLDFQFCDLIVNYDLPWNPMKVEQRIGRIDRYGQKSEAVAIVNMITPDTVDADIYERCLLRIGVFEHAVGGSEEILGEITSGIQTIADNLTLTPEERKRQLQQLADNSIRIVQEEQALESKQAELFGLNVPKQSWQTEIEEAESFWLSAASIQACVTTYLDERLKTGLEHFLGQRSAKTLRLSEDARKLLLDDYLRLPRSSDPVTREWEKWLKGSQPTMTVTFEQDAASEDPKVVHLSVLHPLVRQSASYLSAISDSEVSLAAVDPNLPAGSHPFAVYRWRKEGVKLDEALVAVSTNPDVEHAVLRLLQSATDHQPYGDATSLHDSLEKEHHSRWVAARAAHVAENKRLIEHRKQSLTVSHNARMQFLQEQLARASGRIQVMRQSELTRAKIDFDRRIKDLDEALSRADILPTPVVFGALTVVRGADT
ncbi:MAG: DEAD/DEAH box helicase family protein [Planctomycetes bacterium]|nr:DEAD/DEAH box helicase family protein [Planctomycetota bacterium]